MLIALFHPGLQRVIGDAFASNDGLSSVAGKSNPGLSAAGSAEALSTSAAKSFTVRIPLRSKFLKNSFLESIAAIPRDGLTVSAAVVSSFDI